MHAGPDTLEGCQRVMAANFIRGLLISPRVLEIKATLCSCIVHVHWQMGYAPFSIAVTPFQSEAMYINLNAGCTSLYMKDIYVQFISKQY